jgi:hypothetical protein
VRVLCLCVACSGLWREDLSRSSFDNVFNPLRNGLYVVL